MSVASRTQLPSETVAVRAYLDVLLAFEKARREERARPLFKGVCHVCGINKNAWTTNDPPILVAGTFLCQMHVIRMVREDPAFHLPKATIEDVKKLFRPHVLFPEFLELPYPPGQERS